MYSGQYQCRIDWVGNFFNFISGLILSGDFWRLSSCYLELSSLVFYLYLSVIRCHDAYDTK